MANVSSNLESMLKEEEIAGIAAKTATFVVILLVAFAGNATVIAIIRKNANQRMRNTSNLFIANMAIYNLSLVIWNVPFSLSSILNKSQWFIGGVFGRGLCKFCMFIWFISEILSCGSLSAIAVDRFLLVFFPTKRILSKRLAHASIAFSWVFAFGFSSPVFYYTDLYTIRGKLYCFMNFFIHGDVAMYMVVAFSIFIATPIGTLSCLYSAIILKLLGQKTVGENVSNERKEKRRRENYRTSVLLLISVWLFAFCVLPFWIANMYCYLSVNWRSWACSSSFMDTAFMLTIINAGANPFIYLIFSQTFRNGARNLFWKIPVSHDDGSSLKSHSRRQTNRVQPARQSITVLWATCWGSSYEEDEKLEE